MHINKKGKESQVSFKTALRGVAFYKKLRKNYKFLRRSADAKTFLNATVAP
jgi:hypothetical protein